MGTKLTLAEALKESLQDDNKISKFEAKVIYQLVTSSGHLSGKERDMLKAALDHNQFDPEAFKLLHELLAREDKHLQ
jgi:hypothetical protein